MQLLKKTVPLAALLLGAGLAQAADKPKICFVYPGLRSDGGWSQAQDRGRLEVERQFGDRIETSFTENVPESSAAIPVFDKLAASGCNLIFGTAFGYMDAVLAAAAKYPSVRFEHLGGFKTTRNVAVYNARFYEGRYLTGRIAAKMSKSGQAAYIAPFPIPEVMQGINAFELGAQSIDPRFKTKVYWTGSWFDPDKEAKATRDAAAEGIDIITQQTDSTAPMQVAETNNLRAFGYGSDLSRIGQLAQLTAIVYNWGAYDAARVKAYLDGSWTGEASWDGLASGIITMAPYRNMPADLVKFAQTSEQKIASGTLKPFHGPVRTQASKTWLKKNETAADSVLLSMDFFVLGVVGDVPKTGQ
ncbi:MAG TPA: BMP family ABC transporter substrate-binding protein [Ensifer sp.]|nr:BMP family ABC transporter substrate-binding protein [Ensifer sp.]